MASIILGQVSVIGGTGRWHDDGAGCQRSGAEIDDRKRGLSASRPLRPIGFEYVEPVRAKAVS